MIKASIIISTYNYPDALDLLLSSLIPQVKQFPETEIMIADDGSGEATNAIIQKYQHLLPAIKHIWHEDCGFQKATILNKAVMASTGDYLIFLDGDCVPFPDYVQTHLHFAEKNYFVAGHRILLSQDFTNTLLNKKIDLENLFNALWLKLYFQKKANKIIPKIKSRFVKKILQGICFAYRQKTKWQSPKGCNFAVFREDFFAVNGFDEQYQGWGHEDSDLFIRLIHYGVYIKDAKFFIPVMHLWHPLVTRNNASDNYAMLLQHADNKNCIGAKAGINQYAVK